MYHELRTLGKLVGYMDMPPELPKPFFDSLLDRLHQTQRYDEARRVAALGRHWHPTLPTVETLQRIVTTPNLPHSTRAKAYMDLADCIAEQGDGARQQHAATLEAAGALYQQSSHAFGSLLVRAKQLQYGHRGGSADERIEELCEIERQLETHGAWNDISGCITGVIELGQREFVYVDESIQPRIEHMLQSMRDRGCSVVVMSLLDVARHALWLKGGANVGTALPSLERLSTSLSLMQAPALSFLTAQLLYDSYKKLGNVEKADEVAARLPGLAGPRASAIFGHDDFFKRVQKDTDTAGPLQPETMGLRDDLWRVRQIMSSSYDDELKAAQVQRLCNLGTLYVTQGESGRRALDELDQLLALILSDVGEFAARLPHPASVTWTGHALQLQARIHYLKNDQAMENEQQKFYHLHRAVEFCNQAIAMYDAASLGLLSASARQQLATSHKTLWVLRGDNTGSEDSDLSIAAALHLEAKDILDRCGEQAASRLNARLLVGVWISAHTKNIAYLRVRKWARSGPSGDAMTATPNLANTILSRPIIGSVLKRSRFATQLLTSLEAVQTAGPQPRPGIETFSTLQECLGGLAELDFVSDMDRDDLSALKDRREAIAARQGLNKANGTREMFEAAFQIFDYIRDWPQLWHWVQKSKARSLSDQLGLGISTHLPVELGDRLAKDADAQWKLREEASLVEAIGAELDKPNAGNSVYLRQRLYEMRRAIRQNAVVSEVLDWREGQPLSLGRVVQVVRDIPKPQGTEARSTVFVDWVVINTRYCVILQRDGQLYNYATSFTVEDSQRWKEEFEKVIYYPDHSSPGTEMALLRRLSPLLQPISHLSQPGDLLVFSPSQDLFCVPLHAATLGPDTNALFIERHPIVYAHSTSVSCQAVSREIWAQRPARTVPHSIVAVYEEDDAGRAWDSKQRPMAYKPLLDELDPNNDGPALKFGPDVVKRDITERLGSAGVLTIIAHCDNNENKLLQGIRLPRGRSDGSGNRGPATAPKYTAADALRTESGESTVALMPATSLLMLLACGSAEESRDHLDEPFGLISAFLCRGVSSVVGTMWRLQFKTAGQFAASLRRHLDRETAAHPGIVDLAAIFQQSVLGLKRSHGGRLYHWASFALYGSWVMRSPH